MEIIFHRAKRDATLQARGLDFADADKVFAGLTITIADDRRDYGEARYVTFGTLEERMIAVVWTPREEARHVISMRRCNDRELRRFKAQLR